MSTNYFPEAQALFVGGLGRAANYSGYDWAENALATATTVAADNSPNVGFFDSFVTYNGSAITSINSSNEQGIANMIFNDLIGRSAQPAGATWVAGLFTADNGSISQVIMDVYNAVIAKGSGSADYTALQDRMNAADNFTNYYQNDTAAYSATAAKNYMGQTALTQMGMGDTVMSVSNFIGGTAGRAFTLTPAIGSFTGGTGDDTFNGTWWNGSGISTFNPGDVLIGGGGTDTLNITQASSGAMTLTGANWNAGDSGLTDLNITNTTDGAITLSSGGNFNAAFNMGHLNLTTTADGAGAITIDLTGSLSTQTATINSTVLGNGAQTITAGGGATTVVALTHDGATTVNGTGLTSVSITSASNADGEVNAQTVGSSGATNSLATINVTQNGGGAQTVTSTDAGSVSVTATMGATSTGGAQTITTGAGNDTIGLVDSAGGYTAGGVTVNGMGGANGITLAATHTGIDTVDFQAAAVWNGISNVSPVVDTVGGFHVATDILSFSDATFNGNNFGGIGAIASTEIGFTTTTATLLNSATLDLAGNAGVTLTNGAILLINAGGNTAGTFDVYVVDKAATAANTIAADVTAGTIILVGHVTTDGAFAATNFHSMA